MSRLVLFRALSVTTLFLVVLGGVTSVDARAEATEPEVTEALVDTEATAASNDADAPVCQAYGCDYFYTKPDGTSGSHTIPCSIDCDCPEIPGFTKNHERCYLTGGGDGGDVDEAPVY